MRAPADFEPDAVVVGSGATGAMAAYVLTRAGAKVLMLEAGRNYDPVAETPMLNWDRDAPLGGIGTPDKPFGFYDATVNGGWEVPGEPYTSAEGHKFMWWRSRMLGGRTNHWARHVPRFGPYDFKPKSRDGLGVDWPLSYDDVAPYLDRTERLVGVSGVNWGLENHPDSSPGILQPPPPARIPELLVAAAAKKLNIPCVPARRAIITRDMPDAHAPRAACYYASPCGRGCSIGAAFQTTTSLLPMAMATGRMRIVTGAMAAHVKLDASGKATAVEYFDADDNSLHLARGRIIILAASACETARILLNSKDGGLANSSGQVGRNLTDTVGMSISAQIPALESRPRYNEDGYSMGHSYIPWWLYKEQAAGQLDFPRGYHFEFGGGFGAPNGWFGIPEGGDDGYGPKLKEEARRYYGSNIGFALRGEQIPNENCYCELDPNVKDKFGLPVLRFHWKWTDYELKQVAHGQKIAREIISAMGGKVTSPDQTPEEAIKAGGEIIHEIGTTRMGENARTSVTNQYCQTWDVNNLYVVDGGVFASNAHKNPTLTMMAIAWRACDEMSARMRRGEL